MIVLLVHVHVKPESVEAFKTATIANASGSVQEPDVVRFDLVQQADDPTRFAIIEIYRTAEGVAAHKQTAHYATWRDTVQDMMASARQGVRYGNVWPDDASW